MTTHSSRRQRMVLQPPRPPMPDFARKPQEPRQHPPLVRLVSFGFLHSDPPAEAHAVFDLRAHFHDPHLAPDLRARTSVDPRVRAHVLATPGIGALVEAITATALAMASGPARADVVIAIGCSGGRHRPVDRTTRRHAGVRGAGSLSPR